MDTSSSEFNLAYAYLLDKERNFSLILGGPLYQILRKANLTGDAPQLLRLRIMISIMLTWVPLLLLSVAQGYAWDESVKLPFLYDLEIHVRLLLVLPLLIFSELIVNRRMGPVVSQFLERGIINKVDREKFDTSIDSAIRWRNSVMAEVALLVFVYTFGVGHLWRTQLFINVSSWQGIATEGQRHLSLAGWWMALVSLPLFQFLLLRWYFRLFIWTRFLWRVSRIKLNLMPLHPDRCGGLGFLSAVTNAFAPLLFAQGTMLAGMIASRIIFNGAKLVDFKLEIFGLVALTVFTIIGPLLVFTPKLAAVRLKGDREAGALTHRYVQEFDKKWLRGGGSNEERLIGNADIQSLADMGNSFSVVQEMKIVPFTIRDVANLGITTLLPLAPLLLTMFSLEELLANLIKMVL